MSEKYRFGKGFTAELPDRLRRPQAVCREVPPDSREAVMATAGRISQKQAQADVVVKDALLGIALSELKSLGK